MKTARTSKSSTFLHIVRVAATLAAVVMFAHTANADPRPGGIWNNPPMKQPTTRELLAGDARKAVKLGTQTVIQTPLKNAAVTKVPCARCEYRPPMLVRSGKPGR
jgi:hypothetical protein